jgi:putative secretion ATPase (PEP-CTERM system associated)
MYASFYGLKSPPFQLTPDSHFFFESSVHAKALAHLKYGLHQAEGFIVITGEVGAGKTTLVEHLCSGLDRHRYAIAKVSTTQTSADDTLRMIAAGFGVDVENLNKGDLLKRLENTLLANFRAGRRSLLLVDEAQNLEVSALEELRMLSNFLVGNQALLQSFLLGQPQFRPTLALPRMEQLRQRVLASYHLGALCEGETRTYIEHRLAVAGGQSGLCFTAEAFRRIHDVTGGIPRRINTLCSRLLLLGFLDKMSVLDETAVVQVADEMLLEIDGAVAQAPAQKTMHDLLGGYGNGHYTHLQSCISSVDARLGALATRFAAPRQWRQTGMAHDERATQQVPSSRHAKPRSSSM